MCWLRIATLLCLRVAPEDYARSVGNLDPYTPAEMAERVQEGGIAKARLDAGKTVVLGVLAGAFIGLGGLFSTVVGTESGFGYGPTRLAMGFAFSLGLVLVLVGGAELFTGNTLIVIAWVNGRVSTRALLRNWTLVYLGNLIGAVATAFGVYVSGVGKLDAGRVAKTAIRIAEAKASLSWTEGFVRGIFGNALVCLAVWLCFSARSTTDKILSVVLPISAFVAVGFEHSIANMYSLPLGFWLDAGSHFAPGWSGIFRNWIAVTLGNVVGGGGMVGFVYWFIYLRRKP